VPKKAETERGGISQLRIFWRQWSNDNATESHDAEMGVSINPRLTFRPKIIV